MKSVTRLLTGFAALAIGAVSNTAQGGLWLASDPPPCSDFDMLVCWTGDSCSSLESGDIEEACYWGRTPEIYPENDHCWPIATDPGEVQCTENPTILDYICGTTDPNVVVFKCLYQGAT